MNLDKDELQSLVEDVIASRAYHAWEDAGLTVDISLQENGDSYTPQIKVVTGDGRISVRVETVDLVENSEVKGWAFEVTMGTSLKTSILNDENGTDEAVEFYSRCTDIAKFAKIIAETEIYPEQYFE